jgi:NADH:ubiquinone oxidoreductase subunit 5 (subunit L)/multisubunit Na+/H+ antiporter MnhA subunit
MIIIDFDIAISLLLSIALLLVIGLWFRYTKSEKNETRKSNYFAQCPYCSYVFFDFDKKKIKICPQCQSYIEERKGSAMEKNIQKDKNRASVLVTVIMLILAMMALAVGLLSVLGSQGLLSQNQVNRIKADQFSKGLFWKFHHETNLSGNPAAVSSSVTLDGKVYTGTVTMGSTPPYPELTNSVTSTVNY